MVNSRDGVLNLLVMATATTENDTYRHTLSLRDALPISMASVLGNITGLLTCIPNIGAFISGVLIVLVGFSAGWDTGMWAIGVYLIVQTVDGYIIVPMVAKRSVDLAPALVLAAQLLFGALFGIIGLMLADPIVAMVTVALGRRSERKEASPERKNE